MSMNMVNQLFSNYTLKLSPDTFKSSTGSEAFFISGVTTAFLNPSGTSPSRSEQLTNLVIEGRRMSKHSLIRNVSNGSNRHDLVGYLLIIFPVLS